jgi:hypothetical protein
MPSKGETGSISISQSWIRGSESRPVPKCHDSATLLFSNLLFFEIDVNVPTVSSRTKQKKIRTKLRRKKLICCWHLESN